MFTPKQYLLLIALLFSSSLYSDEQLSEKNALVIASHTPEKNASSSAINKQQIVYLMQCNEIDQAISLYQKWRIHLGRHDFEILQRMAIVLLEQGARSKDPEKQLLSIFGSGIGSYASSFDILEEGIRSPHAQTQSAAVQFLGQLQDDRTDELLIKAMASPFFFTRMEAAHQLSLRKHRKASGQIEALMYRVPPPFRFFFPQFFALIGTSEATAVLRQLMQDTELTTRLESILNAARNNRDDLLPLIRASVTHLNIAEQEACAAALGFLKDSKSLAKIRQLTKSPAPNVQLAAWNAIYMLGDSSAQAPIFALARTQNIFAIGLLGSLENSEEILAKLLFNEDIQVRINAALALLKRKDSRCLRVLEDILIRDSRDLGFQPQFSLGRSLIAWKVVPSAEQHNKEGVYELHAISLSFREQVLKECLELKERDFLLLAQRIFDSRQTELIPLLVHLLENIQTEEAIGLLKKKAQMAGAPLLRAYCHLSLYRLKQPGPHEKMVRAWISENKTTDLIRFRDPIPWDMRVLSSPFELTPEESSNLLVESYQALADRHDEQSLDILLEVIKEGNQTNRYALAGLLLRAVQ